MWQVASVLESEGLCFVDSIPPPFTDSETKTQGGWSARGWLLVPSRGGNCLTFSCGAPIPCSLPEGSTLIASPFSREIPQETPSKEVMGTVASFWSIGWLLFGHTCISFTICSKCFQDTGRTPCTPTPTQGLTF